MSYKVSHKRHLAKTISYRILSTSIGFLAMWWVSGSIKIGAAFGVVELIYKPLQYYIHERVWYRWIKFGLVQGAKIQLAMDQGYSSPTAKIVTAGSRLYGLVEGELFTSYDMAAQGQTLQAHLWSSLERASEN